jgi:gag-polypeptide of LTR copia-type
MSQNNDRLTSIILTDNKNYVPWSRSVFAALKGRERLGFITGTKKEPIPVNPEKPTEAESVKIEDWQVEDYDVLTMLLNTLDTPVHSMLMYCESSKSCGIQPRGDTGNKKTFHTFSVSSKKLYKLNKVAKVTQSL